MPHNLPLLDRLGIREQIETTSIRKHGIEFVSPSHGKTVRYDFANAWDKRFPILVSGPPLDLRSYIVENAAAKGADVIEGCRVTAIDFPEGGPPVIKAAMRPAMNVNGPPISSSMRLAAIRCWQRKWV